MRDGVNGFYEELVLTSHAQVRETLRTIAQSFGANLSFSSSWDCQQSRGSNNTLQRERERKIEYERGAGVPGQYATTAVQSDTGSTGGASERRTTALPAGTLRIQNVSVFDGEMGGGREREKKDRPPCAIGMGRPP
jgi:hypothetical protein